MVRALREVEGISGEMSSLRSLRRYFATSAVTIFFADKRVKTLTAENAKEDRKDPKEDPQQAAPITAGTPRLIHLQFGGNQPPYPTEDIHAQSSRTQSPRSDENRSSE